MAKFLGTLLTDTIRKIEPPILRVFVISLFVAVVTLAGWCVKLASKMDTYRGLNNAAYEVSIESYKQLYIKETYKSDSLQNVILRLAIKEVEDSIKANDATITLNKLIISNQEKLKSKMK